MQRISISIFLFGSITLGYYFFTKKIRERKQLIQATAEMASDKISEEQDTLNCSELKISLDDFPNKSSKDKTTTRDRNLSNSSGGSSDGTNAGSMDSGLGTPVLTRDIDTASPHKSADCSPKLDNNETEQLSISSNVGASTVENVICKDSTIQEQSDSVDPSTLYQDEFLDNEDGNIIYQFLIPNNLGGSMVGTKGSHIRKVRNASGAQCWISRNRFDKNTQIVNLKGTPDQVTIGLKTIRKRFPRLNIKPINTSVPLHLNPTLQPELYELSLPINCHVDAISTGLHQQLQIFVQQPTHGSFHGLDALHDCIQKFYSKAGVPSLPRPVNPGAVVIAPSSKTGKYFRAVIADVYPEDDTALIRLVDYGGYDKIPVAQLKQIRTEVMHLPFQCIEAQLAYVLPRMDKVDSPEYSDWLFESFLKGRRLQVYVAYINYHNQPCVDVYFMDGPHQGLTLQEVLVQKDLLSYMPWQQTCCIQPFETMPLYYQNHVTNETECQYTVPTLA